jgi:hypothetical protein
MGLYALIGLLFLWVLVKLIGKGPDPEEETPESLTGKLPKDVQLGGAAA